MNLFDKIPAIPDSETFPVNHPDFLRECVGIVDRASSTSWGLPDRDKIIATLLKQWYNAASAAQAGVDEGVVDELRNKLKGANMARGRLEKRVAELEELVRSMAQEDKL